MNKTTPTTIVAWMRRQPRALLIPGALLLAIVLITAVASMHGAGDAPSTPQTVATAPAVPKHATQPTVPQASARAARAPVAAPGATASLPTPTTTTEPPVAPAPITPPAGVEAGRVQVIRSQKDQFGSWAQVSQSVESASQTTFTTPATPGSEPDWRVTYKAWFKLDRPASIATLGVAEGAGRAEAQIDSQPLGGRLMAGRSETASVALQPGWHTLTVIASREGWKRGPGITVRVQIGDGTTAPAMVTPWAVTARPEAEPQSTNAGIPIGEDPSKTGGVSE